VREEVERKERERERNLLVEMSHEVFQSCVIWIGEFVDSFVKPNVS